MNVLPAPLFPNIFDQFDTPAVLLNVDGTRYPVIAINTAARSLYPGGSYQPAKTLAELGLTAFLAQSGATQALLRKSVVECMSTRLPVLLPVSSLPAGKQSGSWLQLEVRPVVDEAHAVRQLLLIRHDLTALMIAGEAVKSYNQLHDDLRTEKALNRKLEAEIEKLKDLNKKFDGPGVESEKRDSIKQIGSILLANSLSEPVTQIKDQRDSLRHFFMQAPAGIAILGGPTLIFELVNPPYQALFPGRNIAGKPIFEAMPELVGQPIADILHDTYKTGKPFEGTELLIPLARYNKGPVEERYFNFIYQARRNQQDLIDGLLVFAFEVTDMVIGKRQLQDSEKRYRSILNAMPQIAWTNAVNGEFNFVNERWHEFTGLSQQLPQPIQWQHLVHPDDLDQVIFQFNKIIAGNSGGEFELRYRGYDGQYRWFLNRMRMIRNEGREILFWVGTSTDIQELKVLQQQKDDFVNIASHELKTPLTSLKVSMQLINERSETLSPFMIASLMNRATKSLDKVVNLVEDLLNVGKLSQGQLHLERGWFHASQLISEYLRVLHLEGRYQIRFSGDLDVDIFGDLKRIDQVLSNMVNNAIKYAPESKNIEIDLIRTSEGIKVSVTDSGPGISPELIPHLFDRYYHVENRDFQNTGLGLGLYICAEIVRRHGGEIGVESGLGKGSTFWFTLSFPAS